MEAGISDEMVYTGLRCIAIVRNAERQYEAWAEPGCEGSGRFYTDEQAHHPDYSWTLVIWWLCSLHHRHAHGKTKPQIEQQAEGGR